MFYVICQLLADVLDSQGSLKCHWVHQFSQSFNSDVRKITNNLTKHFSNLNLTGITVSRHLLGFNTKLFRICYIFSECCVRFSLWNLSELTLFNPPHIVLKLYGLTFHGTITPKNPTFYGLAAIIQADQWLEKMKRKKKKKGFNILRMQSWFLGRYIRNPSSPQGIIVG